MAVNDYAYFEYDGWTTQSQDTVYHWMRMFQYYLFASND